MFSDGCTAICRLFKHRSGLLMKPEAIIFIVFEVVSTSKNVFCGLLYEGEWFPQFIFSCSLHRNPITFLIVKKEMKTCSELYEFKFCLSEVGI